MVYAGVPRDCVIALIILMLHGVMIRRRVAVRCLFLLAVFACLSPSGFAKKKPPLHPVNLNSASALELQEVPGIGPATADKILQMRKSYGALSSVDDLLAIKGLKLEKMRKYLTVGKAAQSKKPTGAQAASVQGETPAVKGADVKKGPAKPAMGEEEEP